jgi:GNAT superfamily N-acetyltransferase
MNVRSLQEAEAERLLAFWNQNVRHDPLTLELLFEKVFADPDYDPDKTLLAEIEGQLVGFVQAVVRNGDPRLGFVKLFAVNHAYRRRGIAGRLFEMVEDRMRAEGVSLVRVLESSPNYLQPGLDPRYTEAVVFLERRGYKRFGETVNMEVDLQGRDFDTRKEEEFLAGQGFEIRRARCGDEEALAEFLEAHFPSWAAEVGVTLGHDPVTLHLAVKESRVVGFAAHDANNIGTGWFGPMGTDPALRGKGIGGVLLLRCLQDMKKAAYRTAIIPWVGPIAFYAHYAGAQVCRVFWRYEKELAAAETE